MKRHRQPTSPVTASDRRRLIGLNAFLFILFSTLAIRFYQIQIIEHDRWVRHALAQHQYTASIPFMRGSFYSNTSIKKGHPEEEQPFVIDVPKFHLFIDPASIPSEKKKEVADQLFDQLKIGLDQRNKLFPEFDRKSRSRKIAAWLDREERVRIENWWKPFAAFHKIPRNAIFFSSEFKRSYPFGSLLGAVLHTVQLEKDPTTGQGLPTGGLEMLFNSYLEGKPGKKIVIRSPRHPIDSGTVLEEAENGADIYLTVNHYLQAIAETELQKGVEAVRGLGGWAVMMDPYSGEILALAQTPSFDPMHYTAFFNDPKLQEATKVKAVTDCYEPGSIFKPITLAVCMKANEELIKLGRPPLFTADEKIPCSNGWFPGRSAPLKDARVYSYLNMDMAVQKSSNIYMARIVDRLIKTMGDEWYRNALQSIFGFGQKTNIELPAENPGLLPTPGKVHPNGKLEWSLPTPYSLAIGHNILINGVQMVRAYAILANGGKAVQPHLVRKIVKNGNVLADFSSYQASDQVLSPEICSALLRSLKFPTKEGGTSRRGDVHGYTEVGKSGTSEKIIGGSYSKDHNISSFLGFVPADKPRFVLLISIDDPEKKLIPGVGRQQFGGVCAAPVFSAIASRALEYLGVAPDDPYGYPMGDPRRNVQMADWHSEVQALKELYEKWNIIK